MPKKRKVLVDEDVSPVKRSPLSLIDDAIATMDLRISLDSANSKAKADRLEIQNSKQGLLQLPQELLDIIYDYLYSHQVLEITNTNGRAYLVDATTPRPYALPSTCRKLRADTVELLYTRTTFRIVTYKSISMLDEWEFAIRADVDEFLDFLKSISHPQFSAKNIEIVGI